MEQAPPDSSVPSWQVKRQFPRLPMTVPVELRTPAFTAIGETVNVSLGGLLVGCRLNAPSNSEIAVRFNLPTGHSIATPAVVVHVQPGMGMGVRFLALPAEYQQALSSYVEKILRYTRRSARVARRFHVTIRGSSQPGASDEELGETVLLSRHGGLLVSRSRFKLGERVFLGWPERQKGAYAKVVFRVLGGVAGLVEIGFEFEEVENFWGLELPPDTPLWRRLLDPK